MPNDEHEMDRLDLQNHLFYMSLGERLHLAPIKTVHNCLDIGTGTGIWAMDFADGHPESQVIGLDLSAIQPVMVPPNLRFLIDDVEDTWHYREKFDLIHARMMVGSILDWPLLLERALNHMRPGGWIELQDCYDLSCDDDTFALDPPSCPLAEWWASSCRAFESMGRSMVAARHHKTRLEEAGFVDVKEVIFKWPINTWPREKRYKELGIWSSENTRDALEAIALAPLTRVLKWKPEEVQLLLQGARRDIKDTRIHAYWDIRVVYGRKP